MAIKKIMANKINSLTDARYFAAWNVDYLGFDLDVVLQNLELLNSYREIIEWLVGPKFLGSTSRLHIGQEIIDIINSLNLDALIVNEFVEKNLSLEIEYFTQINTPEEAATGNIINNFLIADASELSKFISVNQHNSCNIFVDLNQCNRSLEKVLNSDIAGVVLHGGLEEKVGLMDFDQLDHYLEKIFEYNELCDA